MPKPIRLFAVLGALIVCALFALPTFNSVAPSKADNNPVETVTPVPVSYKTTREVPTKQQLHNLRKRVSHNREIACYWRSLMQKSCFGGAYAEQVSSTDPLSLRQLKKLWWHRRVRASHQAHNPPHKWQWQCIHSGILHGRRVGTGEGPWDSNTNPKYDGGLQMDLTFQSTYGPELLARKGPAYNWTEWEQMWVAERAYSSGRGFTPWPNTARDCGLL
jgi:hypothetical protein